MIDLKLLQKNPDRVAAALKNRGSDMNVDDFLTLDAERRRLLTQVEDLKSRRNKISAKIAHSKKEEMQRLLSAGQNMENAHTMYYYSPDIGESSNLIDEALQLSNAIKALDAQVERAKAAVEDWMLGLPNIPHESVPVGKSEADNREVRRHGTIPQFAFTPKEHWDVGVALGGLDFERAAKLAGSRFAVAFGWAARLERALVNFFLDIHTRENGYIEVAPPLIVNRATMTGTGQLPKFAADLFKLEGWDYFLIPTAEVPLTNLHADEIMEEADLPRGYCAQTPCFRSEAGSYGKDTRGLIRQHQFTKVEMVRFAHPDDSYNQLDLMRRHAEDLLERLDLPYRTLVLCSGDMGFGAAKTFDIEVWLPGQNTYREISSCSNCEDFQARRANIRYRPHIKSGGGGKPQFVHTLNGSGLAVGRTLVAIVENGQQADGTIVLPKALVPYMGRAKISA